MNRDHIRKEGRKWVEKGIIDESQLEELVELYPGRSNRPLLLTFAAIFIGLGFLSFIASNWSAIPDIGRMTIIILALIVFYLTGDVVYRKKSRPVGLSLITIAVLIFGSGIFLTGQMYNYTSFSAFPFFIWATGAFLVFAIYADRLLFTLAIIIATIGQIYSAINYMEFYSLIGLLLLIGFGYFVYRHADWLYATLFSLSFVLQALILTVTEHQVFYWLIVYLLGLYVAGILIAKPNIRLPFIQVSVTGMFLLAVWQVFFLEYEFVTDNIDGGFLFPLIWTVLMAGALLVSWKGKAFYTAINLLLFLPVFYVESGAVLVLLLLFAFSLGWLIYGYQQGSASQINKGTISFVSSTVIAYTQLAWDFMDKSLFFFLGGVLLFTLSFFLEKKRRDFTKRGRAE
ncbi:DUF2157 domain-containing protein [Thalassobacillus pellis]|uniref:DUF2157 domain-containing protein n=1 Tax=Thalassobacillus pellis TaxID=748008 RepID=UPI00195F7A7E|nr:DUF2157 domain-containing protein [Thalassobacillus pellis]MBM7554088.1 putative membrane protein [Thalassobacillus pellis]